MTAIRTRIPALFARFASCRLRIVGRLGFFSLLAFLQLGCALHYHDAKTGTEHVWGLAHVKMRATPVGGAPAAVATQVRTFGLGLQAGSVDYGLSLGWDSRTRLLVPDDSALSLEWPGTDLFDVRVGSTPPAPPIPADPFAFPLVAPPPSVTAAPPAP